MQDLVEWLRAQLDEDERIARGCSGTDWWEHPANWVSAPPLNRVAVVVHDGNRGHIVRHDPARVLREIDAKRRLLDLHGIVHRNIGWQGVDGEAEYGELPVCGHCVPKHTHYPTREDVPEGPCPTLRLLALPYADRPGYREEWRP